VTVWIYSNTAKEVGDIDHLKVFATEEAAERWFAENDPEGVAFEYRTRKLRAYFTNSGIILKNSRNSGSRLFNVRNRSDGP
jgi:hypothetical protein